MVDSLVHLSLQKNELRLVPRLLQVNGRYCTMTDVTSERQPQSGRRSSRKSSRRSSRRSSQQHYVSKDVSVNSASDVTECDGTHDPTTTAADAVVDTNELTSQNGLYSHCFIELRY